MQFSYRARTTTGEIVSGLVEAADNNHAIRLLHDKQLFVISLAQTQETFSLKAIQNRFKRVSGTDIVNFTRQLSTMVTAGLSLPEALGILRAQSNNAVLSAALADIEHQVVGGSNLADALASYPSYFNKIYLSLIRAGESSGKLDKVLGRLAETLEDQREFRSKVTGALIYPVIIVIAMIIVVTIMMTVVVPKLTELYKDFNISLPGATLFLISVSDGFIHWWWVIGIVFLIGSYGLTRWRQTPSGTYVFDSFLLKIPLFGDLRKKVILVEFTRTLAMLISSGIHILEGLKILEGALDNVLFRNAVSEISKKVEKGFSLGETFGQYAVFPPIVSQMMKVGEETGKLDETLNRLSTYFQAESEHLVKGLTTAIEPIIMIFLGLGVGFIVISVITPIYNLTSQFK